MLKKQKKKDLFFSSLEAIIKDMKDNKKKRRVYPKNVVESQKNIFNPTSTIHEFSHAQYKSRASHTHVRVST